ncbi:MAG: polysaccharide lyase 6 family protein [Chitinophagaceae bacterium]|nr:polysaccharide lyase 6 family protein [Chitinophagaceae bacterium]
MKYPAITLLILLSFLCASATDYKVSTPEEFQKAATLVLPGDAIVIANGNYANWFLTVDIRGTANKPIIVRAETTGKVIFSGKIVRPLFTLTGAFTVLSGLTFSDCRLLKEKASSGALVELKNTLSCRVTECIFTRDTADAQYIPLVIVSGNAKHNRIDHCSFTSNIDNMEVQIRISKNEVPQHTQIDANIFRDKPKVSWKNANGGECVQIGQDPVLLGDQYAYSLVRNNRFIACKGEAEVISNKSSGNRYIGNQLEDCAGELVMRGGHECIIDSNVIKGGTGGIRINGTHHTITNNHLEGLPTGIRFMYGMARGKHEVGFYIAASDCAAKQNQIDNCGVGIFIGDGKNVDWTGKFDTARYPSRVMQDIAPFNNDVSDNVISNSKRTIADNTK